MTAALIYHLPYTFNFPVYDSVAIATPSIIVADDRTAAKNI